MMWRAMTFAVALMMCVGAAGLLYAEGTSSTSGSKVFPSLNEPSLHNGHRVTEKVLSGAQPEGDESFKALAAMGVKTIVSVDGAKPDVDGAATYGMRYVHLPITYGGVEVEQGKAIAKALAELPGPIYIHCHHGKHRSAAAVAVACVYNGTLAPAKAEDVLRTFGTGENYKGLWKAARDARPINSAELAALKVDYVPAAKIDDLAEAMVKTDQHFEYLKLIQKAGWKQPPNHPDLDPAHEALLVQENLHESGRLPAAAAHPDDFQTMMKDNEAAMEKLHAILKASPVNTKAADEASKAAEASCKSCHKAYRD